jgi:hypothetical protein
MVHFKRIFSVAIHNEYIVYNSSQWKICHPKFRLRLVKALVQTYRPKATTGSRCTQTIKAALGEAFHCRITTHWEEREATEEMCSSYKAPKKRRHHLLVCRKLSWKLFQSISHWTELLNWWVPYHKIIFFTISNFQVVWASYPQNNCLNLVISSKVTAICLQVYKVAGFFKI